MTALPRCPRLDGTRCKTTFRSVAKARQAAVRVRHDAGRLWPYECDRCGWWHLTSIPQPQRKGMP